MVKISIKKEEKTIKPKQKQKQKQSQKVVVNIGSNVIKPKRKRATRSTLQKNKVVNRQQIGPTQINVPQALPIQQQQPQQPMNELIKYLKENEAQKVIIKEKEQKINELEKDKKDKERSQVLTEDEVQNDFSNVYNNSNFSSLTNSGTATPRISYPVNSNDLITALRQEADRRSENPNSGQISFDSPLTQFGSSGSQNSLRTLVTNTTNQSSIPSIASSRSQNTFTTLATNDTNQSSLPSTGSFTSQDSESSLPSLESISSSSTLPDDLTSFISQPPEPVEETIPNEEPLIEEELKQEPEKQIVVYGPQRATAQTATATQQMMGMDNSNIPAFLRPINTPIPTMHLKDIIGQRPTISETREIRQARINKLDKKPLLAIEPQSTQADAEDTIKLLEDILKPKTPTPTKPPPTPASEPETTDENVVVTSSSVEGFDEFQRYITDKNNKELTNAKLAEILIRHDIKDPNTGKTFYIRTPDGTKKKIAMVHGNSNPVTKTILTELLLTNYKPGFVYK